MSTPSPSDTAPITPSDVTFEPGTFCWWEIAADDLQHAIDFYTQLFGWTAETMPMDHGEVYVMLRHEGKDVLGLYRLNEQQREQGVRPHWLPYIAVENADRTVSAATANGGTALLPAFDVYDLGRMALIQDPQGATFGVWQAKNYAGAARVDAEGAVCWNELAAKDRAKASAFYRRLFGYEEEVREMATGHYSVLKQGEAMRGGILQMTDEWGDIPPHFMSYVGVADTDATAACAGQLGGSVVVQPFDIPNIGRMAVLQAPDGATFSIITFVMPEA